MEGLAIVERLVPGFWYAVIPAGDGPFPVIGVLHSSSPSHAGWAARDAVHFAAHGFAALAIHGDDVAGALAALRAAPFSNGRLGVFTVGAGAERLASALGPVAPDALAMHGPSPVEPEAFAAFAGPMFISHGCDDEVFPVETTRKLEAAARTSGQEPEVHYYDGMDHGLNDEAAANRNTARFIAFFLRHLS